MKTVQPIRDIKKINDIKNYLESQEDKRNYVLVNAALYLPMRISDLLELRVRDAKRTSIQVKERKTGKILTWELNPVIRRIFKDYCEGKQDFEYLFPSRQESTKNQKQSHQRPITRQRVDQVLKEIGIKFGLEDFGCHSLRKTFGYHYYQQTKDIEMLRMIYNHANTQITTHYIGMTYDMINKTLTTFEY